MSNAQKKPSRHAASSKQGVTALKAEVERLLGNFNAQRQQAKAASTKDLKAFKQSLSADVEAMLSSFDQMQEAVAAASRKSATDLHQSLERHNMQRKQAFKKMVDDIRSEIAKIQDDQLAVRKQIMSKLEAFRSTHAEMSREIKAELVAYVKYISDETDRILSGEKSAKHLAPASAKSAASTAVPEWEKFVSVIDDKKKFTDKKRITRGEVNPFAK